MPKCIIDGREAEFTPGQNLVEVAKKVGIQIPFFCYHPALTVVAQCRMCVVEIEKMPKLQTACSTPAAEGMVVKTRSEKVIQAQKATMEFLLINHPLDCPVCDKSGECDLQDFSFKYGDAYSRYTEEKRTYVDLDMGPVIKKNMNRCIHCTRCIRFGTEVAGIHEMVAVQRGNNTEITTIDGRPLETDYAGNYADLCPTGSLLLKDFRFKKRVWFLKRTSTVCEGCARGCNMTIHQDNNVIYRCTARENLEINKYWLCDEGRFNFHYVNAEDRVVEPRSGASAAEWADAIAVAKSAVSGKKLAVLVGSDLTQEEGKLLLEFLPKNFSGAPVFHFGTPGIRSSQEDAAADRILKRKSKTANLHGLEKLGFKGFDSLPAGTSAVLVIRGGRATLPELKGVTTVGLGVFRDSEAQGFAAVLPGASFAEKDGTIVNFEGREQHLRRAINPPGQSKQLPEILMMWANSKGGQNA
ncbi:MAG: 2Fe-2S iron-sulfur cluster-binding protein [Oligoflexia bacterium]|nr:2Fe-2S iron-sulfur cluster-binding protein [Oligoflexia bacterium]